MKTAHRPPLYKPFRLTQILSRVLPGCSVAVFSITSGVVVAEPLSLTYEHKILSDALPASLPPELQPAGKWLAFKNLWQELNAIEKITSEISSISLASDQQTHKKETGQPFLFKNVLEKSEIWPDVKDYQKRAFYQILSSEQAKQFNKQLDSIFGENANSTEARLLRRLTQLRIQEMSLPERKLSRFEVVSFPKCRAAFASCYDINVSPTPPTVYLVKAIDRIETQIRSLMSLRAKGKISAKNFKTALSAIQKDAQLALYLDQLINMGIEKNIYFIPSSIKRDENQPDMRSVMTELPELQNVQAWEKTIRNNYTQNKTSTDAHALTAQENAQILLQQLKVFRRTLDKLNPLLIELER